VVADDALQAELRQRVQQDLRGRAVPLAEDRVVDVAAAVEELVGEQLEPAAVDRLSADEDVLQETGELARHRGRAR
jgi:hypothetical protein